MRRGFLSATPKQQKTSATNVTISKTGNAQAIESTEPSEAKDSRGKMASSSASDASDMHTRTGRNDITLPPDCDFTTIYDDSSSSFILQADHRNDSSPFFGYFPLRQCAGPGDNGHSMVLIHSNVGKIEDLMQSDVWKATLPDVPENERCFLVESRDGKGMAMIARRDIDAGELIFKERCGACKHYCVPLARICPLKPRRRRPIYVSAKTKDIMPDQSLKTGFFHRSAARRLGKKQRAALLSLSNCHPPEVPSIIRIQSRTDKLNSVAHAGDGRTPRQARNELPPRRPH